MKEKDEEVKKKEKLQPWNVDTLSKDGFQKTLINKPKPRIDTSQMSDEERDAYYKSFVQKHESELKHYGMLGKWDNFKHYLMEHPGLVCDEVVNYLLRRRSDRSVWVLDDWTHWRSSRLCPKKCSSASSPGTSAHFRPSSQPWTRNRPSTT